MGPIETLICIIAVTIWSISIILGSIFDVDNRGCYKRIWIGIGIVVLIGIIGK